MVFRYLKLKLGGIKKDTDYFLNYRNPIMFYDACQEKKKHFTPPPENNIFTVFFTE